MANAFIKTGSPAPTQTVYNQKGENLSLEHYIGQKLIVFVYPKANTGTCTKEALSLKEGYAQLKEAGYEVVGLSPDTQKAILKFIEKQELPYDLLGDPEHQLIEALGAWGEKQMYGKTYMGVKRSTFLLDEKATITHVIEKVISKDHAGQILSLLAESVD